MPISTHLLGSSETSLHKIYEPVKKSMLRNRNDFIFNDLSVITCIKFNNNYV